MWQKLKRYLLLISVIFIIAYIVSEYYEKRVDEEIGIYNKRISILYNTHQVLYSVIGIQEGLYTLLYNEPYSLGFLKTHTKELEEGMDNLSRGVSYIFYIGKDDELFRVYSHKIEVIETVYPKFLEKVNAALMANEGQGREMYLEEAIKTGESLEALTEELDKFAENEYVQIGKSLPALTGSIRRLRNVTGLLSFIAIAITSFVMFYSCRPFKRSMLPFLKAIKDGKYDFKVEMDNAVCCREVVSTFDTVISRIKEGEKESESLTITDSLTGAYNRRYLDMRINEEMNRCARYGTIFSLSIIDIDHFKNVNDTLGHQVGDSVLKELVMLIRENSRDTDIVARYGGEEFAIIYPCTPKSGVLVQVERLRTIVEGYKFRDSDMPITISIGVADSAGKDSPDQVIQEADSSLYMAKNKGRNRCVIIGVNT